MKQHGHGRLNHLQRLAVSPFQVLQLAGHGTIATTKRPKNRFNFVLATAKVYHLQAVTRASKRAGSPSQHGTTLSSAGIAPTVVEQLQDAARRPVQVVEQVQDKVQGPGSRAGCRPSRKACRARRPFPPQQLHSA